MPGQFVKVAQVDELEDRKPKKVQASGQDICLVKIGSSVFALSNACTHRGCKMDENGKVEGDEIECTCHGSRFKIETGEVTAQPARVALKRFDVQVKGTDVLVSV